MFSYGAVGPQVPYVGTSSLIPPKKGFPSNFSKANPEKILEKISLIPLKTEYTEGGNWFKISRRS
jgi:hypothetical protein